MVRGAFALRFGGDHFAPSYSRTTGICERSRFGGGMGQFVLYNYPEAYMHAIENKGLHLVGVWRQALRSWNPGRRSHGTRATASQWTQNSAVMCMCV